MNILQYENYEREPYATCENQDVPMGKWLLDNIPKPISLLDVGCGTGVHTRWFNEQGIDAIGITINRDEIKDRVHEKVTYGNMLQMPFNDNAFDCVFILGTIEHTHAPFVGLCEANRVLKRGGFLFLDICSIGGMQIFDERFYYHKSVMFPIQIKDLLLRTNFNLIFDGGGESFDDGKYIANIGTSYYLAVKGADIS